MQQAVLVVALLLGLQRQAFAQGGGPALAETASGTPLFTFQNGFWVNLHHFLYVLGRAREGTPDSQRLAVRGAPADLDGFDRLTGQERRTWEDAIADYRGGLSRRDIVFDRELIAITSALAVADDAAPFRDPNLPLPLRETLERAAPVYRKAWWDRHARSNAARIGELNELLRRHGKPVADMLARLYQQQWPSKGLTVQVCAYSNWAGAYSTAGGLVVMASTDDETAGTEALETVFHEAMHQWDDVIIPLLNSTAQRVGSEIPRVLSHALIFYTAGYVVSQIVPGHRPYAQDMWARGVLPGRAQLDAHWLPYLRGEGTFAGAIESLVAAFK